MSACASRAGRRFTVQDDAQIRAFSGPLRELAAQLNRGPSDVSKRRQALGLEPICVRWTVEEQALLEANDRPLEEVARLLGKPLQAIQSRRHHFGIYGPAGTAAAGRPWRGKELLTRRCLRCRRPFETTRFVFVCSTCKKSEDWS